MDLYELKSKLGKIKKGNPNSKLKKNLEVIKMLINSKSQKLLQMIFLLNILKEFQNPDLDQNKKEQDLKY